MTIAVAGNRSAAGVAVAEVNLKFIWDVVSAIRVGRTGEAFVLDRQGRLIAHPDISLVLRADEAAKRPLRDLRAAILARPGEAIAGRDIAGTQVLAAMAPIPASTGASSSSSRSPKPSPRSMPPSGARCACSSPARPWPRHSPGGSPSA